MPIYMYRPSNNGSSGGGGMTIAQIINLGYSGLQTEFDVREYNTVSYTLRGTGSGYCTATLYNSDTGIAIASHEIGSQISDFVDDITNINILRVVISSGNGDGLLNIVFS